MAVLLDNAGKDDDMFGIMIGLAGLVAGGTLLVVYACVAMAGREDKAHEQLWDDALGHRAKEE